MVVLRPTVLLLGLTLTMACWSLTKAQSCENVEGNGEDYSGTVDCSSHCLSGTSISANDVNHQDDAICFSCTTEVSEMSIGGHLKATNVKLGGVGGERCDVTITSTDHFQASGYVYIGPGANLIGVQQTGKVGETFEGEHLEILEGKVTVAGKVKMDGTRANGFQTRIHGGGSLTANLLGGNADFDIDHDIVVDGTGSSLVVNSGDYEYDWKGHTAIAHKVTVSNGASLSIDGTNNVLATWTLERDSPDSDPPSMTIFHKTSVSTSGNRISVNAGTLELVAPMASLNVFEQFDFMDARQGGTIIVSRFEELPDARIVFDGAGANPLNIYAGGFLELTEGAVLEFTKSVNTNQGASIGGSGTLAHLPEGGDPQTTEYISVDLVNLYTGSASKWADGYDEWAKEQTPDNHKLDHGPYWFSDEFFFSSWTFSLLNTNLAAEMDFTFANQSGASFETPLKIVIEAPTDPSILYTESVSLGDDVVFNLANLYGVVPDKFDVELDQKSSLTDSALGGNACRDPVLGFAEDRTKLTLTCSRGLPPLVRNLIWSTGALVALGAGALVGSTLLIRYIALSGTRSRTGMNLSPETEALLSKDDNAQKVGEFSKLVLERPAMAMVLADITPKEKQDEICRNIIRMFEGARFGHSLVGAAVKHNLKEVSGASDLFRASAIATVLVGLHLRLIGEKYLHYVLAVPVRQLMKEARDKKAELNPDFASGASRVTRSASDVEKASKIILESLITTKIPLAMQQSLGTLRKALLESPFKDRAQAIVTTLFLNRLILPAIVLPFEYGVVDKKVDPSVARLLLLVSKTVGSMAGDQKLGGKEKWMEAMEKFRAAKERDVKKWLRAIGPVRHALPVGTRSRAKPLTSESAGRAGALASYDAALEADSLFTKGLEREDAEAWAKISGAHVKEWARQTMMSSIGPNLGQDSVMWATTDITDLMESDTGDFIELAPPPKKKRSGSKAVVKAPESKAVTQGLPAPENPETVPPTGGDGSKRRPSKSRPGSGSGRKGSGQRRPSGGSGRKGGSARKMSGGSSRRKGGAGGSGRKNGGGKGLL